MRELVTGAGLPAPEIEDAGGCVTVRFRPGPYVPTRVEREVSDRQRAILALLVGAGEGYALREIVLRLDDAATSRQVREDLSILRTLGLAECRGTWPRGAVEAPLVRRTPVIPSHYRLIVRVQPS